MRNIYSIFALIILSLWPSLHAKAASETTLVVKIKKTTGGADSVSYKLSQSPFLSFTNERLLIMSQSFSKSLKDVISVKFSPVEVPEASSGSIVSANTIPQGKDYVPKTPEYNQTPIYVPIPMSLSSASFSLAQTRYDYTGEEIRPEVIVSYGETVLQKDVDYEVTYQNNINPGTATIKLTGKGTYFGTAAISFTIVMPPSFMTTINGQTVEPSLDVMGNLTIATYVTPTGIVTLNNYYAQPGAKVTVWLEPAEGYWASKDSINIALTDNDVRDLSQMTSYTYTMPESGPVTMDVKFYERMDISQDIVTFDAPDYKYEGSPVVPVVTVQHDTVTLKADVDFTVTVSDNEAPGNAQLSIQGMSRYMGTIDTTFVIKPPVIDLASEDITVSFTDTLYTNNNIPVVPDVVVKHGLDVLEEHVDYEIACQDNDVPGIAKMTITGIGGYTGTIDTTFIIKLLPYDLVASKAQLRIDGEMFVYTAQPITPSVVVMIDDQELVEHTDFSVEYNDNINVGIGKLTVKGQGSYCGTIDTTFVINKALLTVKAENQTKVFGEENPELAFSITGFLGEDTDGCLTKQPEAVTEATAESPVGKYAITIGGAEADNYNFDYVDATLTVVAADVSHAVITFANDSLVYTGDSIKPAFTVQRGLEMLKEGIDFVATYANNTNAGIATMTVEGIGNYMAKIDTTFVINKALLTVKAENQTKVFGEENPELAFSITGFLGEDTDGCLTKQPEAVTEATAESPVGDYAITIGGAEADNYSFGYVDAMLSVTPRSIADALVVMTTDSVAYTSKPVLPEFFVQCGSATLTEGTDYTVAAIDNSEVGIATLTIEGTGNYEGKIDTTFVIFLKPSISVIINGKQITPDVDELLNNSSPATFVSEQGSIMVDNYYALAGSTVMLTVTPNQPYYIFKENISGINLFGNNPTDSTMQQHYRYIVPQNGVVVIEAEFVIPSAISNRTVDDLRFEVVDGKTVRVLGAREAAPVSVFDARGQQVDAEVARSERELIVRLANQPQGLYIIKVNNKTFKVYRK